MRQSAIRIFFVPALLVIVALAARVVPGPRTIDDSYITFRYARNLLAGNGFTYNPGERVQGTTTPLYTLLMAGLGVLAGGAQAPFPTLALSVNTLADAGTAVLLFYLGKRLGSPRVGFGAGLAWGVAPFSVTFAIGGLETSVYVLLLTGCAAAYAGRRNVLAALCGALALLTRPDALILLGPLALDRLARLALRRDPEDKLQFGELAALLPVILWFGFAWVYFGSPVAHSVQAKLAAYRLEPYASLVRLIQHYTTPFMEYNWIGNTAQMIGLVLYPFLFIVGARQAYRRAPRLLAFIVYPWLYFLVFALPNPLIFRWYLTPPLPAYFLFLLLGLDSLLQEVFTRLAKSPAPFWRAIVPAALVIALPALLLLGDWKLRPDHGSDRPAPEMAYIQLELLYQRAAERVAPLMDEHSVLAAGDVGVLGYHTPGKILDAVGLNSPESLRYYPLDERYYTINYAIAPELIIDQQPDFVVILEVYGREGLLKDARFQAGYALLEKIPTDMYGSDGMLIFERKASSDG